MVVATTLAAMQLLAGAVLERPPGPKYVKKLRYAELELAEPLPKPATLARWREALPAGFQIALQAPERCWRAPEGPLRRGPDIEDGLTWLAESMEALRAQLLVVKTGASVTTGARDRERLQAYFDRVPRREGTTVVWRATGLWEPDEARAMAAKMAVLAGFDAVDDPVPAGSTAYASLAAEGLRRSFSHAMLLDVHEKLLSSGAARAFVSIDSEHSFREASLLQSFSEGPG